MDNSRLIAIACGLIVMLVIIMVFRGCMGEPDTSGLKKTHHTTDSGQAEISIRTGTPVTEPPELDIFGRPVTAVVTEPEILTEFVIETSTGVVETDIFGNEVTTVAETDVFGNVITATESPETDIFGSEVTTAFSDTTTEVVTEEIGEIVEETTLSPIEQYEKDLNDPHSIGGFNHGQYDDEGNPIPTLPPDFAIIIN